MNQPSFPEFSDWGAAVFRLKLGSQTEYLQYLITNMFQYYTNPMGK